MGKKYEYISEREINGRPAAHVFIEIEFFYKGEDECPDYEIEDVRDVWTDKPIDLDGLEAQDQEAIHAWASELAKDNADEAFQNYVAGIESFIDEAQIDEARLAEHD